MVTPFRKAHGNSLHQSSLVDTLVVHLSGKLRSWVQMRTVVLKGNVEHLLVAF